ncbi:unnamed protein product, partial [Symbiodinium sp. CCMP2456]
MRRPTADARARLARPVAFDFASWRRGPKHHAVVASIPWCAGWVFGKRRSEPLSFSLKCLRGSVQQMDERAQRLRVATAEVLRQAGSDATVASINKQVLAFCSHLYPRTGYIPITKPSMSQSVVGAVAELWARQDAIQQAPPAVGIRSAMAALQRTMAFKQASRKLRQASRAARRDWFEARIREAEQAAERHDIGGVYRVLNLLAPKRRREQVRIKGPAGELLGPKAEFEEIFAYYQKVFSRDVPFDLPKAPVDAVSEDDVLEAIGMLKGGKAVPPSSVPTEIWLLCPAEYAAFLTPRLNPGEDGTANYPPEASMSGDLAMEDALAEHAREELATVLGQKETDMERETGKSPQKELEEDGERRPKWQRENNKGGKGQSSNSWEGWRTGKRQWERGQQKESGETATEDNHQTKELLKCLVKMSVRHEQELMRIRPDVGFIAFCDTSDLGCMHLLKTVAKSWSDLYTQGKVTSSLKVIMAMAMMKDIRERAEKALQDEEQLQRCFNVGWVQQGATALDPVWVYHTWNAKEKKQEVAETPPLKHSEVMRLLDLLIEHLPREGVLTRFASTKRLDLMQEFKTEVVPMMLQLSLRGNSSQLCYDALKALSGNAVMKLQGVRWRPERAQKPPLAKALEEAYLATAFCDWAPRDQQSWAVLWIVELTGVAVGRLKAEAWEVCWEARLSNPARVTDGGDRLAVPVFEGPNGLDLRHVVADEELELLRCLRSFLPVHKHQPSFTLLTRNELVTVARELLDDESWSVFNGVASRGSEGQEAEVFVSFPPPCYRDITTASEAEKVAEMCLREGSGSLWSSARE